MLEKYKNNAEQWLENYFKEKTDDNRKYMDPMVYSLKVGGKRIRPVLMQLTYELYGNDLNEVMPFACAMEMIHTYSLIHDDLPAMDNDDLRRGHPTNHKVFGEAKAILAGDGLLNEAMTVMFKQCLSGDLRKAKAAYVISESSGIEGMIKGQIIDIESENKTIDEAMLRNMHKNKTGKLIKASILAGAIIGGADEKNIEILEDFGENLGLAFQIKDDILDIEGDPEKLGKSQSDGDNGKTTFITVFGIEKCKEMCNSTTEKCYNLLGKLHKNTDKLKEITKFLLERNY